MRMHARRRFPCLSDYPQRLRRSVFCPRPCSRKTGQNRPIHRLRAYTAGQLDIEAAKQALAKSKNKEVRDFADQMVLDHTEVNKQALALVKKLKVKPEDNDTSRSLTKQGSRQAGRACQAQRRRLRQGLRRQRGCLPQYGECRARKHSYSVGEQSRTQEPATNRPENFPGPPATC
jgi:hypothetical protein